MPLEANIPNLSTIFPKIDSAQLACALVQGWDTAVIGIREFKIIAVEPGCVLLKGMLFGREQMFYAAVDALDDIKRSTKVPA